MSIKNEMKLEFLSRSQNEAFARVAVAAFAAQLDPTLEEIADIKTAVSEAVTNAIIHGYDNPNEIVQIITRISDNSVMIEVIDRGKGIEDIELARQPLYTSKPELERSGMGFTVMETFMDEVEVISAPGQGTKVRMVKHINHDVQETERD
ncbi:MAG: anti-sigma F factor [Caldicoprobacterales bacterium]|jgi:stage II sporulation protein AB (anti-sigma F factor)|nr:anti-sigma F factor [Clostridiales bacterium]